MSTIVLQNISGLKALFKDDWEGLLGNADTLLHSYDVLDGQTRKQIFTDIYDDAQWLTGLVENLLSITKIVDGSVKLSLSDQVVDDII